MTDIERVEILKRCGFPGMDKELMSKLRRPEYYGIQLTADASRSLG